MKKDLEMMNQTEPFSEHDGESMEEILASIRKIMDSSSPGSEENKNPSPKILPSSEPHLLAREAVKEGENILVLTKKINPSEQPLSKESRPPNLMRERLSVSGQKPEERTPFESLVTSSLSPLLQTWLEKNLAPIVEKVVKEELRKFLDPHSKIIK